MTGGSRVRHAPLSVVLVVCGFACDGDRAFGGGVPSDGSPNSMSGMDAGTQDETSSHPGSPMGPEVDAEAAPPRAQPIAGSDVVGAELVFIPISAGTFTMGSPADESERHADEGPLHRVALSAFEIGQTEVTHGQYARYLQENPGAAEPVNWSEGSPSDEPVTGVNLNDAAQFAQWAGGRLPTEAEWECAARAGTSAAAYGELEAIAWYWDNAHGKAQRVGTKQPNAWGLHDMLGNAYEWVSDWYSLYDGEPAVDPTGPATGRYRIARGASFNNEAGALRAAARFEIAPDDRPPHVGFRVARTARLGP